MFQICFRSHESNVDAGPGMEGNTFAYFFFSQGCNPAKLKIEGGCDVSNCRRPCIRSAVALVFQVVFQMSFQMVSQIRVSNRVQIPETFRVMMLSKNNHPSDFIKPCFK